MCTFLLSLLSLVYLRSSWSQELILLTHFLHVQVSVQTSEQHAADFDGKAWIKVLGWYSQTAEMPLALPGRTTGKGGGVTGAKGGRGDGELWEREGPRQGTE